MQTPPNFDEQLLYKRGGKVLEYDFSHAEKRKNAFNNWQNWLFKSERFLKKLKEEFHLWNIKGPVEMIYNKEKTRLSYNLYSIPGNWSWTYNKIRAKLSWYTYYTIGIINKIFKR